MSTLKMQTWQNPDGTENYKCRAWVNFNGQNTIAIRASGNISSLTDLGVGEFRCHFATALADVSYAITGTCTVDGVSKDPVGVNGIATGNFWVTTGNSNVAPRDPSNVMVAVFR